MAAPPDSIQWGDKAGALWCPKRGWVGPENLRATAAAVQHWAATAPPGLIALQEPDPLFWGPALLGCAAAERPAGVFPAGRPDRIGPGPDLIPDLLPSGYLKTVTISDYSWSGPVLLGTSGTMGPGSVLMRRLEAWTGAFTREAHWLGLGSQDRLLCIGYAGFSLTVYALLRGLHLESPIAVLPDGAPPAMLLAAQEAVAPTLLYGAPGTLRAMADGLPDAALPDIRLVPTGGGPLRPSEKAALHRVMPGAAVLPFYGATETGYISLANPKQKVPQGSAGRVVPDVQLTVLPENQVAGDGGGVRVVSPDLAQGQVASGGQIVPLADTDGGHVLRDRVSIDADGFLTVLGRSDAVIPVGGMLLDPGPVERRLESLPEIQEAMLLPLTRPGGACVPQAILCLAAGSGLSAALRQEIRGLLSAPERPRKISLYPGALPLNASGKRDRKALMAWLDAQANRTTMRSSTDR